MLGLRSRSPVCSATRSSCWKFKAPFVLATRLLRGDDDALDDDDEAVDDADEGLDDDDDEAVDDEEGLDDENEILDEVGGGGDGDLSLLLTLPEPPAPESIVTRGFIRSPKAKRKRKKK